MAATVRNISDTALWAATFRAKENLRPDALFRDPFAERLIGTRGEQITAELQGDQHAWAWATRTYLFDQIITEQLGRGVDIVINLAAGLDARPYRLPVPEALSWIELDLPELLKYKEEILAEERPRCALERIPLDLSDLSARRALLERLSARAQQALVITEGLLVYLGEDGVAALARDLRQCSAIKRWVTDLASPGLLRMIQKSVGEQLSQAGAHLTFGPREGPQFFVPYGWKPTEVRSTLKTAARLRRVSLLFRLMALLPESKGAQGSRPWSATCLLEAAD